MTLILTEKQKEEALNKKVNDFRAELKVIEEKYGLTIVPLLRIDNKFITQRTDYDGHSIEGIAKVVPFEIKENANITPKKNSKKAG